MRALESEPGTPNGESKLERCAAKIGSTIADHYFASIYQEGVEHIKRGLPGLIAPTHETRVWDAALMARMFDQLEILPKYVISRRNIAQVVLKHFGGIPITTRGMSAAEFSDLEQTLHSIARAGYSTVIFPSGYMRHKGRLMYGRRRPIEVRSGTSRLALRLGLPVYPVCLAYENVWRPGSMATMIVDEAYQPEIPPSLPEHEQIAVHREGLQTALRHSQEAAYAMIRERTGSDVRLKPSLNNQSA